MQIISEALTLSLDYYMYLVMMWLLFSGSAFSNERETDSHTVWGEVAGPHCTGEEWTGAAVSVEFTG